ncbi:cell division topological specificity factor MinE [Helicobacter sp. MIT 05-5293]|nr:cell division topological specificity factor MinE [Helicobacter sp. MIT 05-5293]TLD80837.1 cell division topological specificity factor MinE [Helicobacter sp. MIT 05-5293]
MSMMGIFRSSKSAQTAKDRLKIVLAHERTANIPYLEEMQEEILKVVYKYTRSSQVNITTNSNQNISTLEVEITLGDK